MTSRRASSAFGPFASAFGLYLFLGAFNVVAAAVIPWLLELWEHSPRLGATHALMDLERRSRPA
ncbi:MAG TPA: hypothetical protein VF765_28590 [Polyangiaceae bacterium]